MTNRLSLLVGSLALLHGTAALATCRVSNETKYSFTVESGNTSNQRVGAHTTTSIGVLVRLLKFAPKTTDWLTHQVVKRFHPLARAR